MYLQIFSNLTFYSLLQPRCSADAAFQLKLAECYSIQSNIFYLLLLWFFVFVVLPVVVSYAFVFTAHISYLRFFICNNCFFSHFCCAFVVVFSARCCVVLRCSCQCTCCTVLFQVFIFEYFFFFKSWDVDIFISPAHSLFPTVHLCCLGRDWYKLKNYTIISLRVNLLREHSVRLLN